MKVIGRQTDRCKSMLITKGSEYAPKAVKNAAVDRLAHFKKAAVVMNSTPKAALMGMLSKHLISVSDMCTDERQYAKEQWMRRSQTALTISDSPGNRRGGIE